MTQISHPNRLNTRKDKKGSGCAMCKPWKHKWESFFTPKEKAAAEFKYGEENYRAGGHTPFAERQPKKKKKAKQPFFWRGEQCPFCKGRLKEIPTKGKSFWVFFKKFKKECACGAKVVEDCPCCHKETWFKDEVYKHEKSHYFNCGFTGKRRGED